MTQKMKKRGSLVVALATITLCAGLVHKLGVNKTYEIHNVERYAEKRIERNLRKVNLEKVDLEVGVGEALNKALKIKETNLEILKESNEVIETIVVNNKELIPEGTVLYASTNLNARVAPNVNSERVCGINQGDKVIVSEDNGNGWVKVQYKESETYVCEDYLVDEAPMLLVSSTAYYDKYNRTSASGRPLVEGYSLAGKVSWIHKSVNVYSCNEDGTVGNFLGTYRFDDTGYGQESGVGESKILKGRTIGTIENGTCVDFFFDTEEECIQYGRRNVYIQILD